jgi:uncharacterized circularly permuted ATP-grasp superfamily protein
LHKDAGSKIRQKYFKRFAMELITQLAKPDPIVPVVSTGSDNHHRHEHRYI